MKGTSEFETGSGISRSSHAQCILVVASDLYDAVVLFDRRKAGVGDDFFSVVRRDRLQLHPVTFQLQSPC